MTDNAVYSYNPSQTQCLRCDPCGHFRAGGSPQGDPESMMHAKWLESQHYALGAGGAIPASTWDKVSIIINRCHAKLTHAADLIVHVAPLVIALDATSSSLALMLACVPADLKRLYKSISRAFLVLSLPSMARKKSPSSAAVKLAFGIGRGVRDFGVVSGATGADDAAGCGVAVAAGVAVG